MTEDTVISEFHSGKPWRTLWTLFRPQRRDLVLGELLYILKASPVWVIPIVTANIIDVVSNPSPDGSVKLGLNAVIGAVMIIQNIPSGMLYGRFTSRAIRGMDAHEFAVMVSRVGRFADQFDDQLIAEFYAPPRAEGEAGEAGDAVPEPAVDDAAAAP